MFAKCLFMALLLAFAAAIHAQDQAPAADEPAANRTLTPQQKALQAELSEVGPQLVSVATQVAELVDKNKAGEVWDNASDIARAIITKDAFVNQITADRAPLGALKSRQLSGLGSTVSDGRATSGDGPITPAGTYINVAFASRFGTSSKPVRELVSFHLDNDQKWRVTGYTLR